MNKIIPTVGRKVWYFPSTDQFDDDTTMIQHKRDGETQPLDATVIAVYADDIVNLVIFDIHGHIFSRRNVKLLSDGERRPSMGRYATWMPYQVAQAKFAEDLSRVPSGRVLLIEEILKDATSFTAETREEVEDILKRVVKAKEYDEAMDKLTQVVGVPLGLTLVGRIEWMMATVAKDKTVDPTSPSRPLLHYGIQELRHAWDVPLGHARMGDGKVFNKTDIDAELRYRGDDYKQPRYVASPLAPKTKTA